MPMPDDGDLIPEETQHVADDVLDAARLVHAELGPGLPTSVYRVCMMIELRELGFRVQADVPCPVQYRGQAAGVGFTADLLIDDRVLVHLQATEGLTQRHSDRLRTHLGLAGYWMGLVIDVDAPSVDEGHLRVSR